jgi:RNA polymerase sigma factor (sigma-70 family)
MKNIYTTTNATFTTANGETVSYQEIFDAVRTSVEIYGKTKGCLLDAKDLEDLFQDSILKALKYYGSFDSSKARINTWASRIAENCQKDAFKKVIRRRIAFEPLECRNWNGDEYIDSDIEFAANGYEADDEVESSEAMERIQRAIDSLNENQRFILSLHLGGMKPRHMAELIGCTADAAATLLCRARKALKRVLGRTFLSEYGIAA